MFVPFPRGHFEVPRGHSPSTSHQPFINFRVAPRVKQKPGGVVDCMTVKSHPHRNAGYFACMLTFLPFFPPGFRIQDDDDDDDDDGGKKWKSFIFSLLKNLQRKMHWLWFSQRLKYQLSCKYDEIGSRWISPSQISTCQISTPCRDFPKAPSTVVHKNGMLKFLKDKHLWFGQPIKIHGKR